MELGLPLILIAGVLFIVGLLLRRARPDKKAILSGEDAPPAKPSMFGGRSKTTVKVEEPAFEAPRPPVAGFEVEAGIAKVTFAVPVPHDVDDVLRDVLMTEAIEVVRERRHSSSVPAFTEIAVYAGKPLPREIASRPFPDGILPESGSPSMLNLSAIALDPIEVMVDKGPSTLDLPARSSGDRVGPVGEEIRL
ncbi:MAG: hypothetical protein R3246_10035, partial [Acidimicrobiia bacterium]|nr:hypothetical protein [Acidimicrobiia bacterium]